jgi:hypothetical protein
MDSSFERAVRQLETFRCIAHARRAPPLHRHFRGISRARCEAVEAELPSVWRNGKRPWRGLDGLASIGYQVEVSFDTVRLAHR